MRVHGAARVLTRRLALVAVGVGTWFAFPVAALAVSPSPTVSPSPGASQSSRTAGFWIVLLVLVGLLAIYRLRLWRRQ